jgi:hypothetical protein
MSKDQSTLLSHIERFLAAKNMSPSRFGKEALNDPNFVLDLRRDKRRVWPETEARVMIYIASSGKEKAA